MVEQSRKLLITRAIRFSLNSKTFQRHGDSTRLAVVLNRVEKNQKVKKKVNQPNLKGEVN